MAGRHGIFVCFVLPLVVLGRAAVGAPAKVTFAAEPARVTLAPGEDASVALVATNGGEGAVHVRRLAWEAGAGVTVVGEVDAGEPLAPGASRAWLVAVTYAADAHGEGHARFQLSFERQDAKGKGMVEGVAFAALAVAERPAADIASIAEVKVRTALTRLRERDPYLLFLEVRNKYSLPIQVSRIIPGKTQYVKLRLPDLGAEARLAPNEVRAFPVEAVAADAAQPGKRLLVFEVRLAWQERGRARTGSLVATHECQLGVVGESELLKLLGLPTFYLVPGFLILTAFVALWRWVAPRRTIATPATDPRYWAVVITLSLLMAPAYPAVTGWLGERRDYLSGYGLRDVFRVWMISLAAGLLLWALAAVVRWGGLKLSRRFLAPSPGDRPIWFLDKLAVAGVTLPLPETTVTVGGQQTTCFVAQLEQHGRWLLPGISWQWTREDSEGYDAFRRSLWAASSPWALARALARGRKKRSVVVAWDGTGPIKGPTSGDELDKASAAQAAIGLLREKMA